MTSKVLILGCGPAGLLAAHAVAAVGREPVIVSKKRKSEMFGAQYLHAEIPGVESARFEVAYELEGTVDHYRTKVYGASHRGPVSPEDLQESHSGWDIRQVYSQLWSLYVDNIIDTDFSSEMQVAGYLAGVTEIYPSIISTIPGYLLCTNPGHRFTSQDVYAIGDAPERGIFSPVKVPLNTVVCSGDPERSWYRAANILGYHTVEWPAAKKPPLEGVSKVTKPLVSTCTCWQGVHRMGRYGKWQKGVLSHEAYFETFVGLGGEL